MQEPARTHGAALRSVCIMRLSAIGDATHVIPVVLSLQRQLPSVQITWVIGAREATLVGDLPGVEFVVFNKKAGRKAYGDLRRAMKNRRFDALLHMQLSLRANLAAALIPAKVRIGYDKARSKELHGLVVNRRIPARSNQHVRDCLASFLEPLGLQSAPPAWSIPVADQDVAFAEQHLAKDRMNVVISPCSSHTLRNWHVEGYAAVASHAIRNHGARVILVGGRTELEQATCQRIEASVGEGVVNLCGQDTLKQLAALLARADLLVSPDSGPAHIASAVGTDVLGLYAASNPDRSGPYNSLRWCVNRYPEALGKYTGKRVDDARWGAKAEFEGAMDLIAVNEVIAVMDRWAAQRPTAAGR